MPGALAALLLGALIALAHAQDAGARTGSLVCDACLQLAFHARRMPVSVSYAPQPAVEAACELVPQLYHVHCHLIAQAHMDILRAWLATQPRHLEAVGAPGASEALCSDQLRLCTPAMLQGTPSADRADLSAHDHAVMRELWLAGAVHAHTSDTNLLAVSQAVSDSLRRHGSLAWPELERVQQMAERHRSILAESAAQPEANVADLRRQLAEFDVETLGFMAERRRRRGV